MKSNQTENSPERARALLFGCLGAGALVLILIGWRFRNEKTFKVVQVESSTASGSGWDTPRVNEVEGRWRQRFGAAPNHTAEEVVKSKVMEFGRKRLEWIRAKSLRVSKDVPPEIEEFFAAMQRGNWDEIDKIWSSMAKRSGQYEGSTHAPELDPFWPAVLEAYGAAEQAHLWPADKLLEYGEAILGSLRPGMVYVGGTDPGRFIPTLLNESGESEPHVVMTQNALADSRYLEYLREQYSDRLVLPVEEDMQRIFADYVADATKRLDHDEQFPDEPKQLKPGEQVQRTDGKVAVGGQIAVMSINEKLLQWTLEKNPEATFAVEESFPFRSTYSTAVPLGPIMEIRAQEPFAEEHAAKTLDYWREIAGQFQERSQSENENDLSTYSKMAVGQANLLASHNYPAQAEATYKIATEIFPRNTDAALSYAEFLSGAGRTEEARQVIATFQQKNPDIEMGPAQSQRLFSPRSDQ